MEDASFCFPSFLFIVVVVVWVSGNVGDGISLIRALSLEKGGTCTLSM
jgi:hypothetical protein